jgi:hypothetical protein
VWLEAFVKAFVLAHLRLIAESLRLAVDERPFASP